MSQWVRSEKIKVSVETIKLSITFTYFVYFLHCCLHNSLPFPSGGALRDDTKNGCEGDYLHKAYFWREISTWAFCEQFPGPAAQQKAKNKPAYSEESVSFPLNTALKVNWEKPIMEFLSAQRLKSGNSRALIFGVLMFGPGLK